MLARATRAFVLARASAAARHTSTAAAAAACRTCKSAGPVDDYMCNACGVVQLPTENESTPFSVFKVPAQFHVDLKVLDARFKSLQRRIHPDRFAQRSKDERDVAQRLSSLVNTSYATLKDPVLRAEALLHAHGLSMIPEDKTDHDVELLNEVMEARESIAEAQTRDDVLKIRAVFSKRLDDDLARFDSAFKAGDIAASQRAVQSVRYWRNIINACNDWPDASVTRT
eukprot:Amastigsp_a178774_199.p1 type:complete len:227 gc:universal Amastigsp_a178774_199:45-725(+)